MAKSTSYRKRMERNLNVLELKRQDIENKFGEGQIQIDVEGTLKAMSPNTILAIPAALKSTKTPVKAIRVQTYDKAGSAGRLIRETVVNPAGRTMDLDTLLEKRLKEVEEQEALEADCNATAADVVNIPAQSEEEEVVNTAEPVAPVKEVTNALGKVVKKPKNRKSQEIDQDAVALAKQLLGMND